MTEIAAEATAALARLAQAAEGEHCGVRASPRPPARSPASAEDNVNSVEDLITEFHNLLERQRALEPSAAGTPAALRPRAPGVLGNEAVALLFRLGHWANRFRLSEVVEALDRMSLSLACWIARQGGEITHLAPVVDSAARLANATRDPPALERLFLLLGEIQNAVDPAISQDLDRVDPRRPWRILLLNRAIVATRSHQPGLMEEAFRTLVEHLPEDAPTFFREGAGQMQALDYPERVRRVIQRYYGEWCGQSLLH